MSIHLSLVVVTSPDVVWPISFGGKQLWVPPTLLPLGTIFELPRVPNFLTHSYSVAWLFRAELCAAKY